MRRSWRGATTRSTWTPRAPPPCLTASGIPYIGAPLPPVPRGHQERHRHVRLSQVYPTLARRYQQVHVDTKSATTMIDCLRYTLHWRTATNMSTWTPRAPPPCSTVSGIPYIGAPLRPSTRGHQERHRHVRLSQVNLTLAHRYQHVHVDTKSATAMFDCLRYTLHWRTATTKYTWTPRAPLPCLTVSGIPYIGAPLRPGPRGHQEHHRHV